MELELERRSDPVFDLAESVGRPPYTLLDQTILHFKHKDIVFPDVPELVKRLKYLIWTVQTAEGVEARNAFLESVANLGYTVQCAMALAERHVSLYTDGKTLSLFGGYYSRTPLGAMIKSSDKLCERTQDLSRTIRELEKRARNLRSVHNSRVLRSLETVLLPAPHGRNRAQLHEMKETIEMAEALFRCRGSVGIWDIIRDIEAAKLMQDEYAEAEKVARVFDGIVRGSITYRLSELHQFRDSLPSPQEDLSADIDTWLSGDKRIYFLHGEAGLERSLTAYHFCISLDSAQWPSPTLGASFFFVHDRPSSLRFFVPNLLYQVWPSLRSDVASMVRDIFLHGDDPDLEAGRWSIMQERLLFRLLDAIPPLHQKPTVIVIHDIDQCEETEKDTVLPHLLEFLLTLVRKLPWLYVFISARFCPIIVSIIAHSSHASLVHQRQSFSGPLFAGDSQRSFDAYMSAHPPHPRFRWRTVQYNAIFGNLVAAYIGVSHRSTSEERLRWCLEHDDSRLAPLDALYLKILQSKIVRDPTSYKFYTLLRFIACNSDGIPPETIAFYTEEGFWSPCDIIAMVRYLQPVIRLNGKAMVAPFHPSFSNFLLNNSRCSVPEFCVDRNTHLASVCFAALARARPISAVFKPQPHIAPHRDRPDLRHPLLTLWPRYLSDAKRDPKLWRQLQAFVPSLELAAFAWVTEPDQILDTSLIVARYFERLSVRQDADSCSTFLTFVFYVQLWRYHTTAFSNIVPDISSLDVFHAMTEASQAEKKPICMGASAYASEDALVRYRATMELFTDQLFKDTEIAQDPDLAGLTDGTYRIDRWC
ncbi:hypothetical protein PsYK624_140580 [Phanerochaete sordida]|uniref:Nephrocystin 3-like N-terminal domain-containing protein n=1 Tax=Phanerochaete sordida TaxID=48140 RepID=A0A9P3GMQ1_9APHY|nr:hypothetical protein PsYK624_140580 [Phanerochaete sordida]